MAVYVLDTNLFIQAHKAIYPLDVFTSFWDTLKELAEQDHIISIDKVKDEIDEIEDGLKSWIETNLPDRFFKETSTPEIIDKYSQLPHWAESRADHYQRAAIDEFLEFKKADAWLVAYCLETGDTLVTQEVSNPERKNKIPLPEVCIAHGVEYCDMMEMLRNLHIQL